MLAFCAFEKFAFNWKFFQRLSSQSTNLLRLQQSSSATSATAKSNNLNNLTAYQNILPCSYLCRELTTNPTYLYKSRKMSTDTGNYKLTEIEGDLFKAPATHSLAHCVGADLKMGAGIAVKFKQIYGQVEELRAQGAKSGGVAILKDKDRYIYYLVTKSQSYDKPTYESLRASLTAMREHMRSNDVHKVAIPRIGCGIDGLEWDKVSGELKNVFGNDDLEIVVYNFVPK